MISQQEQLIGYLLNQLGQVRRFLGYEPLRNADGSTYFADVLDSMGLVEFLSTVANNCQVTPTALECCVGRRFGTVEELAAALDRAGIGPSVHRGGSASWSAPPSHSIFEAPVATELHAAAAWLAAVFVRLPQTIQGAAEINERLHRPSGWLERHAGIVQRRVWAGQDAVAAAAEAGQAALTLAQLTVEKVGALLVTSEAPPLLIGLAAALHHRLHLPGGAVALEVGGACTGFLAALWTAKQLLPACERVLVIAVEAPSQFLSVRPGVAGEAAALFGDGAAAALVSRHATDGAAVALGEVHLRCDGSAGHLLQVQRPTPGDPELGMKRMELAGRAINAMADSVASLANRSAIRLSDLRGVVAHGGNGRMPAILARKLGLPEDRVWSTTPLTGNLGSATLPAAWALHEPIERGPVIWTGVGAGLTWGAALTETSGPLQLACGGH
jgi:3-oxoacyl-[acyl-carrier-protein] synthase-3